MLAENILIYIKLTSWLGILPYYHRKEQRFTRSIVVPFVFVTISILAAFEHIHWNYHHEERIDPIDVWLYPLYNAVFYIHTVFVTNLDVERVQRLFDTFNHIDRDFKTQLNADHPKLKHILLVFILLNGQYAFMNVIDYVLFAALGSWFEQIVYYSASPWAIYNTHINEFLKIIIVYSILKRFRLYNNIIDINNNTISTPHLDQRRIDVYIKMHRNLSNLAVVFNEIYGFNILISVIQSVLYILRLCMLLLDKYSSPARIWFVTMWMVYSVIQCVALAAMCEKVAEEGKTTITLAYRAIYRYGNEPGIKDKLFILARQATARCPQFTAAGFFKMDFSMLFTFVNLITTYVIVVIQFSQSSKATSTNSTTLENVTEFN